jgi:hypothetical protein
MPTESATLAPTRIGRRTDDDRGSAMTAPAPSNNPPDTDRLDLTLRHAEYLLEYAVEAGIVVEPEVAQRIIAARSLGPAIWERPDTGELIAAITKLAARLHPVTAETLRACREEAPGAIRSYKWIAIILAVLILPLSMISFFNAAMSNSIAADLKSANDLVVALHTQLDESTAADTQTAPPGSLSTLQQFAATMRAVYGHARQLAWIVPYPVWDPVCAAEAASCNSGDDADAGGIYAAMQLPKDLKNLTGPVKTQVIQLTGVYQSVRIYATNAQDATSLVWGAVSAYILPLLYALLGACAFALRSFTEQTEKRTFALSYGTSARFIIAGIGGLVVGLFGNFTIGQSAALSPLAVAFLIGYAADIFFSFLEGSMQNLRGAKAR